MKKNIFILIQLNVLMFSKIAFCQSDELNNIQRPQIKSIRYKSRDLKILYPGIYQNIKEPIKMKVSFTGKTFYDKNLFKYYQDCSIDNQKDLELFGFVNESNIWNGKERYGVTSRNTDFKKPFMGVVYNNSFTVTDPLSFFYTYKQKWIIDFIRSSDFRIIKTQSGISYLNFRNLLSVQGNEGNSKITFLLSPENNYMSVRTDITHVSGVQTSEVSYSIGELRKIKNISLPIKILSNQGVGGNIAIKTETDVINLVLDDVDQKEFDVTPLPDSMIRDNESGLVWRVGTNGEKIYLTQYSSSVKYRQTIIGIIFVISLSSLLLIGIGTIIRWRRKQSKK